MMVGGMHPAEQYEYLVEARAKLLDWVRPLSLAQYAQEFPIGKKSIRATLVHTAAAEWAYVLRLRGDPVPPLADRPFPRFNDADFAPFERAWEEQTDRTRRTLREITDWTRVVEWRVADAPTQGARATSGGIVTQLLFHEVHHRAQVMAMLKQLGISAENLDYSVLKFQRFEVKG